MKAYADSAFLCSLYAPDANTTRAIAKARRLAEPIPFGWLHQLEVRNAMRLRVFRREISKTERDASLGAIRTDLSTGVLRPVDAPLSDLLIEAESLGTRYSEKLGTRSLDVLHVAFAMVAGASDFLGFDKRQLALARAAGLNTPRI